MKLEDQVATRQQCEKLNDLFDCSEDIKTAFYWRYPTNKWIIEPEGYFNPNEEGVEYFPAYGVAELMRMLRFYSFSHREYGVYTCGFSFDREKGFTGLLNEQPAKGLANLLIEELEAKRLTPEEVLKRLNS